MTKNEAYRWAEKRIRAQVQRHQHWVPTLANTAAILKEYLPNFFWVGFYLLKDDHLLLGPFQGPPACVRLTLDKGVCAAGVRERKTVVVPNVHEFAGHVACDDRSQSEIVVPVFDGEKNVRAILDVDSAHPNDFDETDIEGLETIAGWLSDIWPH
jgi:GAF domain-containing protein